MTRAVLDTSVIIEMANKKGKFHKQALTVLELIVKGKIRGIIPNPCLAEIYYVASRLYDSKQKAKNLLDWLVTQDNLQIERLDYDDLIMAGQIKEKYSISIMDSFFLTLSKKYNCKVIFRKREKEFSTELLKEFQMVFLSEY